MQNHVIYKRKELHLECFLRKETLNVLVDYFVKILTRKREKELQLIRPLKYDTDLL